MKKHMTTLIAALLAAVLLTNCVLIGFAAANHRLMKTLLQGDRPDTAVQVPEALGDGGELAHIAEDKYLTPPNDWIFTFEIVNTTSCDLFIEALIITDNGGEGEYVFDHQSRPELLADMMGPDFAQTPLRPGDTMNWGDAHPGENLTDRTYTFVFRGADGKEYRAVYEYDLIMELAGEMPSSGGASAADGELAHIAEDKYLTPPNDWIFTFEIVNTTSCDLFIEALIITDNGGEGEHVFDHQSRPELLADMMGPDFAQTPLRPGDTMNWGDAHPGENLTDRTYTFVFRGADGKEYRAVYEYDLIMELAGDYNMSTDYSTDSGKDLITLRHDAGFSAEVYPGVEWVPVNVLGKSRYANQEIHGMVSETPEVKQREIETLYEALQLFQISGFCAADDNVRIQENGINWEHHKPGYYAVTTNCGCCATDSNWLNYILRDDYEEVGFIATSQRDGSGHIYNYIKDGGWYYFIDLTHYRTDWIATATESGEMNDYYATDFILGNLHRAKTVQAYVDYVQSTFGDPPGLMFQYMADDCLAVDGVNSANGCTIIYEDAPGVTVKVIFDDPNDRLSFRLEPAPKNRPNWR